MTDEELQAIEARLAAATPGPWRVGEHVPGAIFPGESRHHIASARANSPHHFEDAAFIAHAPGDIAALLAEVKRLRPKPVPLRRNVVDPSIPPFMDLPGDGSNARVKL